MQLLHRLFQDMLQNSPILRKIILERLSSDAQEKKLLKTVSVTQLVKHIKYEQQQRRERQAYM